MKINKGFKRLRGQYNLEKFCPNEMSRKKNDKVHQRGSHRFSQHR
ncbi:hypothetical protein MtrunA17_Chr4g0007961 [Medicago truncatula]|uniref:Uncharacterized protein n=1 Tax=Medicago truncatula TaxID=3880 RepID=A0A396I5N3_MEDTR|nr:hypothetical protein MtrunA17_Chr4g0007961 [Medicago truncatula]